MFRFAILSVLGASALVVGQSAVRSQHDVPTADEASQAAQTQGVVPQQINHQGVVSVSGVRFNGIGCFKFAIVDPATGVNLWCNDDNDPAATPQDCAGQIGVVPATSCSLTVTDGVYSIRLGDTDLACMRAVPSSVFNVNNARLRIWFSDDCTEERLQQLTPDQKLTSAPYAHRAAAIPPIGSIIPFVGDSTTLADSAWVLCDGSPFPPGADPGLVASIGPNTPNLMTTDGRFLAGITPFVPNSIRGRSDIPSEPAHTHFTVEREVNALNADWCRTADDCRGPNVVGVPNIGTKDLDDHLTTASPVGGHDHGGDNRPRFYGVMYIVRYR